MRGLKFLVLLLAGLASACASSKISITTNPQAPVQVVSRLAIAPGSGVLGEAIGIELFNSGITVVDANDALTIIGRVGLKEFELMSAHDYAALRDSGIGAVLAAKSVAGPDGTPESANVRITSTQSGEIIVGITWQKGWGGQRGSIADRTMRKKLSEAAREIAGEIIKRIRSAPFVPYFFDDFETYDDGASLNAGKPFDAAGRTKASSEKAHQSRRSARMAIHKGDEGGFGLWGGVIPIEPALPRGSEIWVRLFVLWPKDFEFSATPWMKFIRLHTQTGDKKHSGYNDLYVDAADSYKSVLRTINEAHGIWKTYNGPRLPRDRWESYEVYLSIDNKSVDFGGKGRFRVWRNGKLIFDRTDVPTISTADGTIDYLYLFTYWNNENPPTNHVFIDDLVIATSASPPPKIDASGNIFIGDWNLKQ